MTINLLITMATQRLKWERERRSIGNLQRNCIGMLDGREVRTKDLFSYSSANWLQLQCLSLSIFVFHHPGDLQVLLDDHCSSSSLEDSFNGMHTNLVYTCFLFIDFLNKSTSDLCFLLLFLFLLLLIQPVHWMTLGISTNKNLLCQK